jgi:hypothetical protein
VKNKIVLQRKVPNESLELIINKTQQDVSYYTLARVFGTDSDIAYVIEVFYENSEVWNLYSIL